jgi:YHYH protein/Putative Ig domain
MSNYNGFATNVQLGRLINVSSTWTFTPNQYRHGNYVTLIGLTAIGLPYHGYGNNSATVAPLAQYYNLSWVFRAGTNTASANPTTVGTEIIGYWLNGVAILGPSANNAAPVGYSRPAGFHFIATPTPETQFNYTFNEDLAGGLANTNGVYNYKSYSFGNSWTTGLGGKPASSTVHGLADADVIPYLNGGLTFSDGHSKILGFSIDGYPIYGPYGYSNALSATSGVRRMSSGYTLKSSSYRTGTTASNLTTYPMGIFIEDYVFTNSGDLDTHNGRYCVTPDFPDGTYAYFTTIDSNGNVAFPYVIGNTYYGDIDIVTQEPSPGTATAYPQWVTPGGNLGKIQALRFFELGLQAVDPTGRPDGKDVNYRLISGRLPAGMQLDSSGQVTGNPNDTYSIDGVPEAVTQDRTSTFTVRAISSSGKVTDRNFALTVTGNYTPQLLTSNYTSLGEFLDGTSVSITLSAIDLNNDTITFSILDGELPPGLTLSSDGIISGILLPNTSSNQGQITGWNNSPWGNNPWQFTTISSNYVYNFTVRASDSKSSDIKNYKIVVYAHNDIRADNAALRDDDNVITADSSINRPPILTTTTLGDHATFTSGNYFAFQFTAVDYDNVPVNFSITGTAGTGWDASNVSLPNQDPQLGWDAAPWDQSLFALPPGLSLDTQTGWLTGLIPETSAPFTDYTFGIQAVNAFDNTITSPTTVFTIRVLSALDLSVTWNTPSNLGLIDTGSVSKLSVSATAPSGRQLYYYLVSGSKLPQGLTLLNNGNISGRVSFQSFALDKGATTFDLTNVGLGIYSAPTTLDKSHTFTVVAQDYSGKVSGTRTFTLATNVVTYAPYDNLYLNCSPSIAKRELLNNILGNTDYFAPDDIYRPNDPWWGVQNDIKILVGYGLTASESSSYIAAMQRRHFNKKFYFGDYHYATATDASGNAIYDVIYVDLIEDTKIYKNVNGQVLKTLPASSFVDKNGITLYPNDIDLMINDIIVALGTTNTNTLPQWETSIQTNGKTLGFQTAAVLAYLKPGSGARVLYKLINSVPSDIKNVPFVSDRYILDNNLDTNYNITTRSYTAKNYTSFDSGYIQSLPITTSVDFGLDIPFDHVNGATLAQITALGGYDGSVGDYNNKYIIFTTQENYVGSYPTLTNNGWNLNNAVVPGYAEVQSGSSAVNQRSGVWLSTVANNQITLTFVQQIQLSQVVAIRFGAKAGKTYQYTAAHVGVGAQTVPTYESVNTNTTQLKNPTTFDKKTTVFINNEDQYVVPYTSDSYLKFPRTTILQ